MLPRLFLMLLMVAISHGAELTGQDYWNYVLPKTPMPNAISELLNSGAQKANPQGVSVGVGPGGVGVRVGPGKQNPGVSVSVGTGKPNPGKQNPGISVGVGTGKQNPGVNIGIGTGKPNPGKSGGVSVGVGTGKQNPGNQNPADVSVGVGHGGVGVGVGPWKPNPWKRNPGERGGVGVGRGGVGVRVDPWRKPRNRYYSPFQYRYAASETQLSEDPNVALFFLERDLKEGKEMTLHFTKTTQNAPKFIPRTEAEKLPFSSSEFPQILENFGIAKDSSQADEMKQTLTECETPAINGEKKYCATSLESMVDFTTSSLKTHNISALSTNTNPPNAPKQEYEITKSDIISPIELVACHVEPYPFAVFYCHMAKSTKAYKVNLVGKEGSTVQAIAVCHMDTSSWNPKHLAFQVLKIQPGSKPVCHFLPQDHVVWTQSV